MEYIVLLAFAAGLAFAWWKAKNKIAADRDRPVRDEPRRPRNGMEP